METDKPTTPCPKCKVCEEKLAQTRARNKLYRETHREKLRAYAKKYYAANREKLIQRNTENRNKRLGRSPSADQTTSTEDKAQRRKEVARRYRERNRAVLAEKARKYNAKRKNAKNL